jgi:trans-aconitate methyltransferase
MTLFNRLSHRWLGAPLEDFHGDKARHYERLRSTNPRWDSEQQVYGDLISHYPDGSTVLDVPFGSGRFADVYQRKQMSVIGIDSSADMLAEADRLRGDTTAGFDLRVGDARQLPLADASVDLVVCCRFLVGIVSFGDARKVLAEFRRVVRTAAIVDLAVRHDQLPTLRYPPRRTAPMNARLNRDQLDHLLGEAGFTIASMHPTCAMTDAMRVAAVCIPS